MSTPETKATTTDYDDLVDDVITSDVYVPSVTVSATFLRHEAEFMAALRLPAKSYSEKDQPLENVLLEIGGGALQMTATDGRATVITCIPVSGLDSFSAVVTGEKFFKACMSLPAGDVQISFEGGRIILKIGAFRYKFKDAPDARQMIFSRSTLTISGSTASVSAGKIRRLIQEALPFVPKKQLSIHKVNINGVFLRIGKKMEVFALDGRRAITVSNRTATPLNFGYFFVARRYLRLLMDATPVADESLFIGVHGNDLRIECAPRVIVLRDGLLDEVPGSKLFTNLPEPAATVTVGADSLLPPLKKLALVCIGSVRSVELSVEPEKLILRASRELGWDEIMGRGILEGEEELEAKTTGYGKSVINARDLLQFIKVRSGQSVTIHIPSHGNIVLVTSGETQFLMTVVRMPELKAEQEPAT